MRRPFAIIGIALAIAIYIFYASPLISEKRLEVKETLNAKYTTLKKYERFIKEKHVAETELKKTAGGLEQMEKNIMQVSDPSLAFAKLQSKMQDIADESGIKIITIKTRPSVTYDGYAGLPMEIEGTGGIMELSAFLKSLDLSRFIDIERLDITVTGLQAEGTLRIRTQISGLMKI